MNLRHTRHATFPSSMVALLARKGVPVIDVHEPTTKYSDTA